MKYENYIDQGYRNKQQKTKQYDLKDYRNYFLDEYSRLDSTIKLKNFDQNKMTKQIKKMILNKIDFLKENIE